MIMYTYILYVYIIIYIYIIICNNIYEVSSTHTLLFRYAGGDDCPVISNSPILVSIIMHSIVLTASLMMWYNLLHIISFLTSICHINSGLKSC